MSLRLQLDIVPTLEEDMIDCLLGIDSLVSFSSYEVRRHGDGENLSTLEKVTGRARVLRFDIVLEERQISEIVRKIGEEVGKGIPYSISPIHEHGIL